MRRFGVLVCHRRFGKTVCAVNTLIDGATYYKGEGEGRFAYIAPYLTQATGISWSMLKFYTQPLFLAGKVEYTEQPKTVKFLWNNAIIRLYGADDPDSLRGPYYDGVVIDEVADVKAPVWGEVLRPALADRKGWALFIGTPKGINLFSEVYQFAIDHPDSWYHAIYRADETRLPWLDDEELALAREAMGETAYRQEFLCDFSASSDNVLVTIDQVSEAVRRDREVKIEHQRGFPSILGVDVARFGGDRSVIFRRQGRASFIEAILQGADNMAVVGRVAQAIEQYKPQGVFIDVGGGQGVIDRLRQLGHTVSEVSFGSRASQPIYANLRAEMWGKMAEWVKSGGAIPDNRDLKTDLCAPTYKYDANNRMVLEKKDDLKARGLRSPDLADALALTFAMPVAPPAAPIEAYQTAKTYDPLSFGVT